ncbi:hypothetical protein EDB84DRAFT_1500561 [Lactarius hengduanensis]|nr:hypothetical protein EDB84DRAFT_1500561 [Lactarius hengduanensis]
MGLNKQDVDAEQGMSDTSTLPETSDAYEPVPAKIRGAPTNYLLVSKKGVAIKGQYFIDLSILPPPPTSPFHTTNGAVTADVWVTGNNKVRQFSMKLCSDKGHVCAKIVPRRPSLMMGSEHRPSFDIDLRAAKGDISLSNALAPVSDVNGVRVYFVGDRTRSRPWGSGTDKEGRRASSDPLLDGLLVSGCHTSVRINWDGEPELPQMG